MPFITTFLYSQFFVTPPAPTASFGGKTVIVTGSNTGLGYEAALHIARLGAKKLILAVRTASKGDEARRHILRETGREADSVEVWILDMARSSSVKAFATRAQSLERLDVLIANAGISPEGFELSPDDNEMSAQVNVISTFLLSFLLLPQLQQTSRKHDVKTHLEIVSSELYQIAGKPSGTDLYESLNDEAKFGSASQYSLTKLVEVFVCRELAAKVSSPIVTVVNPGLCVSEIGRNMKGINSMMRTALSSIMARTTEVGSRCLVAGACGGEESHGQFMSDGANQEVAAWLESEEGKTIQKQVWDQTLEKLEQLEPDLRKKAGL
jgi:retinol dehydrogenase-12